MEKVKNEVLDEMEQRKMVLFYLERAFRAANLRKISMKMLNDGLVEVKDECSGRSCLVNVAFDSHSAMIFDICRQAYAFLL